MKNKAYALWLKSTATGSGNAGYFCFEDFFITAIPLDDWPIYTEASESPVDEEDLAPCFYEIEELNVSTGFKAWYEESGYGYIFLEPSFFDLTPYIVDDGLIYSHVYKTMTDKVELALLITKAAMTFRDGKDVITYWMPSVDTLEVNINNKHFYLSLEESHANDFIHALRAVLLATEPGLVTNKEEAL